MPNSPVYKDILENPTMWYLYLLTKGDEVIILSSRPDSRIVLSMSVDKSEENSC